MCPLHIDMFIPWLTKACANSARVEVLVATGHATQISLLDFDLPICLAWY